VRQALDVVRAGAGAGSLLAELALGFCYEEGVGVKARTATAARYYRTAAARGSSDAFRALLRMLDAVRPAERQFTLQD
jgi:TPR repeat protein